MGDHGMGMAMALFMEAFVSIHMSVFVLLPLSKMISRENSKKIFWILFWIRIAILLCFDFFITTGIAVVDFLAVFVGAFLVTPISIKKGIRITKGSERSGAPSDAHTSALIHRLKKQYWYLQNRVLKKRQCMQLISILCLPCPKRNVWKRFSSEKCSVPESRKSRV